MSATNKTLWDQMLLAGAVAIAFSWAATESAAWMLGFQPPLGHPWFGLPDWRVCQPPTVFCCWFGYDANSPDVFIQSVYIAASDGIAANIVAIAMAVWRAREGKRVTTYGSAPWSGLREVRPAGLLARTLVWRICRFVDGSH